MADISALSKISERMRIHRRLVNSTDTSTSDLLAFSKEVSSATKESTDCVKDVANYATRINEDLAKLRQLIKDFTIQIGDKMKALAEAGLFKDISDPPYSGGVGSGNYLAEHRFSSDRFDKQRAENLVLLQKIAEQQQELQRVLCETEGLITKVEETGFFTLGDFDNINGHLNQWIKGLETAEEREERKRQEEERKRKDEEEKKKRAEEEAKRKAEEQRRKDEEEKRRKEEEQRRKEEQRKKDEEARARRNPEKWPTYIYDRQKHHNLFLHGICCAVSAITGGQGLEKDDIVCAAFDSHIDLERYPKNKDEVLISSLIQIKPKKGKEIKLELPMKVYIPIASSSMDNRETVVKVSMNDQKWRFVDAKEEKPRGIKDRDALFVLIEINNFQSLEVIVVSRPKRENMKVKAAGGSFEPTIDKNVRIIVPSGCFMNDTGVHFKVDKDLANRAKADKQFENIKIATSLHGIEFDDENLQNIEMEIYPDLHKIKNVSTHQKVIEKCRNKLVTDMSVIHIATRLHKDGKIQDECLEDIKSKKTEGMKARRLLEEFKNCDADQFTSITEALEKENQGHLAKLLKKTMEDIKNEEANTGSDFVGESDNMELQMVTSSQHGDWTVMKKESLKDFPDGVVISLPAKCGTFDIMGLIVPKGMDNKAISRIADLLYRQSYQFDAKLIVRQSDTDPSHCLVRCVENDKSIDAADTMKKQGFQKGPPDSPVFGICDGEEIIIKLEGNLTLDADYKVVRLKYYNLNPESASASFKIDVHNKKAQSEAKAFSGELRYNVGGVDQGPPRCGSVVLSIPKDEELHRFAPLTLDVPVKVAAKYLAYQLPIRPTPNLDDFYLSLVDNSRSKYRSIKTRADKEAEMGTAREICEVFIKNWASQRPKNENKVQTISDRLYSFSTEFAKEFDMFMKPFSMTNGILSNNGIEELSKHIHDKWEAVAQNLGIERDDVEAIKIDFKDDDKRAVRMLDKWRISDSAIKKGPIIMSHLSDCLKKSKCGQSALKLVMAKT